MQKQGYSSCSEMDLGESEGEVPAARIAGFGPHPKDDKDDFGPVGVRFVERMDPCFLVDPYVVLGWVEERLGYIELGKVTRSGLLMIYCVSSAQMEMALQIKRLGTRIVTCFALRSRAFLKGVITGVALSVEEEQWKLKIPGVCDARCLVRLRSGGETEKTLSVMLSFDADSLPEEVKAGSVIYLGRA